MDSGADAAEQQVHDKDGFLARGPDALAGGEREEPAPATHVTLIFPNDRRQQCSWKCTDLLGGFININKLTGMPKAPRASVRGGGRESCRGAWRARRALRSAGGGWSAPDRKGRKPTGPACMPGPSLGPAEPGTLADGWVAREALPSDVLLPLPWSVYPRASEIKISHLCF